MNIKINHQSQTPIYRQIKNQLKEMILKGEIANGSQLPSERVMAKLADVHRNTIIKAYNDLKADGLISASQGKGYKVTYPEKGESPDGQMQDRKGVAQQEKQLKPKTRSTVNWPYLISDKYLDLETTFDDLFSRSYGSGNISFAAGIAAPESYNVEILSEILENLAKSSKVGSNENLYTYTPYQGLLELRNAISIFLEGKGIHTKQSEIQIVSESNQAIGYLTELLLEKGDTVLTEEPISPDVFREFQLAGAKVVTVPMDDEGMITDRMEPLILKYKPKFIYVNSSFHDPTGVVMSLGRRKHLLMLSHQYGIPVIEDDGASEICFERKMVPSLKALDRGESVIYIYSFTLTFAPGIRVAFVVAPSVVIKNLSHLISLRLVSFDSLSQRLLCSYMESGLYQNNLQKICQNYKEKRDLMAKLLEPAGKMGVSFRKPDGGVYIWCKLPRQMDLGKLIEGSGKKGVTFIPGNVFFPYGTKGDNYIRLNYSYPGPEQIERGVHLLLEAMEESLK